MDINLTAPVNSLGYGVVGLNVALALEKRGHQVALWFLGPAEAPPGAVESLERMVARTAWYNHQAPSVRIYHQFDLAQHVGQGLHAGFPIFELTRFKPMEKHHLAAQDLLLAPSVWGTDVLLDNGFSSKTIRCVPLGVDTSLFRPYPREARDGEATTFLNVGKWEVRKGHDLLVEAFNAAFTPRDNVRLVMACFNPCFREQERLERYNNEWTRLYKESPLGDKIEVLARRLPTQEDIRTLMGHADCGVFPSRAEGWNLEAGEMLALGKHLIITNYSAHTQFCTPKNARLVEIDGLEDAHDGIWFDALGDYWQGQPGQWAHLGSGQLDQLVVYLRQVHHLKQAGQLGINEAGIRTMAELTWEATASQLAQTLATWR